MKVKQNVADSASSIRKLFFGLVSCGFSEMDLHALTLKRIYESFVLPRALYGSELWSNLSQNDIMLLERSHRLCIKTMQNMDRNTRTCVALSSIGIMSLNYMIVKRKLTLIGQLCRLDTSYAAKRLFLNKLSSHYLYSSIEFRFIPDIYKLIREYDLENVLMDYMSSGVFMSKYSWQKLTNMKLKVYSDSDIIGQALSDGLELFLAIQPEVKPCLFWEICRKHPNMLKACKSVVRSISLWFNRLPERVCSACECFTSSYVSHYILWCSVTANHRQNMWMGIWRKFGVELYIRLASLDSDILLSCLGIMSV